MIRLIDRFLEKDIQEVFNVVDECYPGDGYDHDSLRKILNKYPAWFVEEKGKVQGCLISEITKNMPYIWSVSVREPYRGGGRATALIKEFEKHYGNAGYFKFWLQVRTENPAQKLYFDLGYRVFSYEANLYGAHQHGLFMRKSTLK